MIQMVQVLLKRCPPGIAIQIHCGLLIGPETVLLGLHGIIRKLALGAEVESGLGGLLDLVVLAPGCHFRAVQVPLECARSRVHRLLRMVLVQVTFDEVYGAALAIHHELFEHPDDHLFLQGGELILGLVLGDVGTGREEIVVQLLESGLEIHLLGLRIDRKSVV